MDTLTVHAPTAVQPDMRHVGIGWRQPHYREMLETLPALGFLEVHSENFFAPASASRATLRRVREHYPISLHGVGLGLGSALGLDDWHLDQLAALVQDIDPARVSDHACFARGRLQADRPAVHGSDLLPIAFNAVSLDIMSTHVTQVQERLRRPMLVENLSAYWSLAGSTMSEAEFFNALCRRAGCDMLLDVNNLVVNALNARRLNPDIDPVSQAREFVLALNPAIVGEIHLAGHHVPPDPSRTLVIDDHGGKVSCGVWTVYQCALRHCGQRRIPSLIEWDTELPSLDVLLQEAQRAARFQAANHEPGSDATPGPLGGTP